MPPSNSREVAELKPEGNPNPDCWRCRVGEWPNMHVCEIAPATAKPFTLEGHLLMIDHGHGLNSAFLHLSRIDVKPGDTVTQGQRIGAIGATGRATGPHLHWGMKWNDARIDPLLVAGPMPQGR